MFVSYRLFDRCVNLTPTRDSNCTSPLNASASPQAVDDNRTILVWWVTFGVSLFFRPVAELVIRILFFSICALLISTLNGTLILLVGHALLKAFKCDGYDPPFVSSIKAGSLGGLVVIGPSTLVTIFSVACFGGVTLHRVLSSHITFLLELASSMAVSAAACAVGVVLVRMYGYPDDPPSLDAMRAARAGLLGACLLTVPFISTAALAMRETQTRTTPSAQNMPQDRGYVRTWTQRLYLVGNLDRPVDGVDNASSPRGRPCRHVVHTAAETVGYLLIAFCFLAVRLLCF